MRRKKAGSPLISTRLASRPTRPRPPRLAVLWLIWTEYRPVLPGGFRDWGWVPGEHPLQLFEALDVEDKDDGAGRLGRDRVGDEHLARLDHRRERVEELGAALAAVAKDLHHPLDLLL